MLPVLSSQHAEPEDVSHILPISVMELFQTNKKFERMYHETIKRKYTFANQTKGCSLNEN